MCKTAVFYGLELAQYGFGSSHPLGNDRLDAFWAELQRQTADSKDNQLLLNVVKEKPSMASDLPGSSLREFHDSSYIEFVRQSSERGGVFLDRGDTPAYKGVYEASLYVVGSTLAALDMVMTGKDTTGNEVHHGFNPIGGLHHARRDAAGGFCVFNDIGVAVVAAKKKYGLGKIAYIDIDAHHGDGVYYEFEDDQDLLIADIHENGRYLYPGTGFPSERGKGDAEGTKLNISLEPEDGDSEFAAAFAQVEEFVDSGRPELIILQCGADGLAGDPITHLQYSARSHRLAADSLHKLAHKYCQSRIIALGGGGYNRVNLGKAWTEVVKSLASNLS